MQSSDDSSDAVFDRNELFSLKNCVSIVTGGSGDIGSTIATALAVNGSHVVLTGTSESKLQKVKTGIEKRLQSKGSRTDVVVRAVDIRDEEKMEKLVKEIFEKYQRIDVLVTAHGMNVRMPTVEYPVETWEKIVDINLKGTFIACRTVGKYMIKQGRGRIVNISSTAGPSGYKWGYPAYSPSKAGVDALTRTLAIEWAKHGIRVNSIAPFMILTNLTTKFLQDPQVNADVMHDIPMGRTGRLGDLVGAALFLASEASDWMTGQVVFIDGGYMAH